MLNLILSINICASIYNYLSRYTGCVLIHSASSRNILNNTRSLFLFMVASSIIRLYIDKGFSVLIAFESDLCLLNADLCLMFS